MIQFKTPKLTKLITIVHQNINKKFQDRFTNNHRFTQKTPPSAAPHRGLGVATPSAVTETDQE